MARYIDTEKARIYVSDFVCEELKKIPSADVAEVKHGYWVDDIQKITTVAGVACNGLVGYKCSLCGRREGSKEPYCNCGAKMDGVRKEVV